MNINKLIIAIALMCAMSFMIMMQEMLGSITL
jgi:hypothetical protein